MVDWRFIINKWLFQRYRSGPYEPEVWEEIKSIQGNLFVDIGANLGRYTFRLRKNFQTVLAVEPNPRMVVELKRRISRYKANNIRVLPYAISESASQVTLYVNPHPNSLESANTILPSFDYKPAFDHGRDHVFVGREGIPVETRTFDQIVESPADLVKIDVEGAEFMVLSSMARAMKAGAIRRVVVELHNRERREELEDMMKGYGYNLKWLTGPRVKWALGDHLMAWQ